MSSSTSSEIVVEAKHLGKAYQLYAHLNDWLKQVLFGWWKAYFKPFWVLRDIDISVKRGESIGSADGAACGDGPPFFGSAFLEVLVAVRVAGTSSGPNS